MRNRTDIELQSMGTNLGTGYLPANMESLILETLLDIRDLLAHPPVEISGTTEIKPIIPCCKRDICNCESKE